MNKPTVRQLVGLDEGAFDRGLQSHRRRFLDWVGVAVAMVGVAFVLIALVGGHIGNLQAGDWRAAGSVFIGAGGLFLSLGGSS